MICNSLCALTVHVAQQFFSAQFTSFVSSHQMPDIFGQEGDHAESSDDSCEYEVSEVYKDLNKERNNKQSVWIQTDIQYEKGINQKLEILK